MSHVFEHAPTARSKCRGCRQPIAKDQWRFGERLPNPFADGEMTHWFHPLCAAYKRPDALLGALADAPGELPDRDTMEVAARQAVAQPRLARIDGAERSPSGQARCRHCHEPIEKGAWRIRLVFYDEGVFSPGGFVHLACRSGYFEGADIAAPLLHFSGALAAEERASLRAELAR